MIPPLIRQSLEQAMQSFRIAENELNRPNEDAVTLCACHNTRNSVNGFLHSYLLSKSSDNREKHLDDLLSQCSKIDDQFKAIDLSCFKCGTSDKDTCDHNYCLSVEKVDECFNQAKVVKDLVLKKLAVTEKELD
jgi:hypothetical protein